MTWGQVPQGAQEVTDRALPDGEQTGQGQDEEAEKGRPREGAGQGIEEGARRLRQLLVDVLELAPGGAGLAGLSAAALVIATSRPASLARLRGRPRMSRR